jgi:hypothetical protein
MTYFLAFLRSCAAAFPTEMCASTTSGTLMLIPGSASGPEHGQMLLFEVNCVPRCIPYRA